MHAQLTLAVFIGNPGRERTMTLNQRAHAAVGAGHAGLR
jgi:hypothetical protein